MTPVIEKKWTHKDYLRLADDKRYEILGGKLSMMVPAPEFNHQRISMTLAVKLPDFSLDFIHYILSTDLD